MDLYRTFLDQLNLDATQGKILNHVKHVLFDESPVTPC